MVAITENSQPFSRHLQKDRYECPARSKVAYLKKAARKTLILTATLYL